MFEQIDKQLTEIEESEEVRVLFACESGSRAWGFASTDSDYDVRFIYIHPPEWYLAVNLESKRDVIERPIHDALDVSGWDLRKALKLFRKSNPPLLEWLGSPIVYRVSSDIVTQLRELAETYYSPTACGYHYLHMAQGNFREYLKGETVWRKKYFYVLRPLLAIRWIENEKGVIPTEFIKLVEATIPNDELRNTIDALIAEKAAGAELDRGPRIPLLSDFIASELERLENARFEKAPPIPAVEPLDRIFQLELNKIYGNA